MGLSQEYRGQVAWRDWTAIMRHLPVLEGQTVLDIGCGVGDQAALLAERGARVLGFDANEELLAAARSRGIANAEFRLVDVAGPLELERDVEGVWCSFAAAYFPELGPALSTWTQRLAPGGWIQLVEVDDLFGHGPLAEETVALFDAYARDGLEAGRYDFRMGRRLAQHLEDAGFAVRESFLVQDRELSFRGPAEAGVIEAWRARLERMKALQSFCGDRFEGLRSDFLGCLSRPEHDSSATVRVCLATKAAR